MHHESKDVGVQSFELFTGFFLSRAVVYKLYSNKKLHDLISANRVATTQQLFGFQASYYQYIKNTEKAIVTVGTQVVANSTMIHLFSLSNFH